MLGGLVSGLWNRRVRLETRKGPRISTAARWVLAFVGGVIMAYGARLARGCTSGQALSGGAVLSVGQLGVHVLHLRWRLRGRRGSSAGSGSEERAWHPSTSPPLGNIAYALVFGAIGFGFGAVLEMAGFGDTRKLAAQFYLRDLTVLKTMFTAIVVAAVLLFLRVVASGCST